jgi:prophage regulatory protein
MQRFLRLPAVTQATGLTMSSIYDLMAEGKFPKPVPLEGRRVAWLEAGSKSGRRRASRRVSGASNPSAQGSPLSAPRQTRPPATTRAK